MGAWRGISDCAWTISRRPRRRRSTSDSDSRCPARTKPDRQSGSVVVIGANSWRWRSLMELANLSGNRFLSPRVASPGVQVGDLRTARLLDLVMRTGDRLGLRHARSRIAGRAEGDVLEIGVGTGSNFSAYPADVTIHGIDTSPAALSIAAARAGRDRRQIVLLEGDAAALPFPDATFDTVVATFVLCSVDDVDRTLREARRVLRVGGTIRLLEHARGHHRMIASLQQRAAPAWARASGGCRLDHDVTGAVRLAGLTVVAERHRAGGILVEIVAA